MTYEHLSSGKIQVVASASKTPATAPRPVTLAAGQDRKEKYLKCTTGNTIHSNGTSITSRHIGEYHCVPVG